MKRTRRAFALSSLGIGAAMANGAAIAQSDKLSGPRTASLHEDPIHSCFEVSLAKGPRTGILGTFVRATPGTESGAVHLIHSANNGMNWSAPAGVVSEASSEHPAGSHTSAGLTRLRNGVLLSSSARFSFLFEGKSEWRKDSEMDGIFLSKSNDGGRTWGAAQKLAIPQYSVAWTRGSIVEMPDGILLLPLAGLHGGRYQRSGEPVSSFLMRSADQGITWKFHATIARDSSALHDLDEPTVVSLGDQRLLCVLSKYSASSKAPHGSYLHTTVSENGGATWSKLQATSMWGHPAHVLRLNDGRILCTYGYRMHPGPGVKGCISADGLAWKARDIFSISEIADLEHDDLQIGCPSSVQLEDGRVFTAYDVGSSFSGAIRQRLESTFFRI